MAKANTSILTETSMKASGKMTRDRIAVPTISESEAFMSLQEVCMWVVSMMIRSKG